MIYIKRPAAPDFMTDPDGEWMKETKQAIEHYKNDSKKSFEFKMFNEPAVKNELKKIFLKCAYCESNYGAVYDGDVEHFRPKGKVKEKNPQTPGYYWLSNDWNNLFLACQHCNQRRKHQLYGTDKVEGYGKLDQFPVSSETKRLTNPDDDLDLEESVRLLINPCKDNPAIHFEYEDTAGVIVPVSEMGRKSVEVYALQRPLLVQERYKQLLLLFRQMDRVKREMVRMNDNNNLHQQQVFKEELDVLVGFTSVEAPYAGMSRYFVKKFLEENNLV